MKAIDALWFSTRQGHCGFVIGENERGERKIYGGIVKGFDEKADEQEIMAWGNPISPRIMINFLAKAEKTKEDTNG